MRGDAEAAANTRPATYGTLTPGSQNHGRLDAFTGEWRSGWVGGRLVEAGWGAALGYPGFQLDPDAAPVQVQVFESAGLPMHGGRLDAFDGPGYCRAVAKVQSAPGDLPPSNHAIAE